MAFENYPEVEKTTPPTNMTSKSENKNLRNVLIGLLVVALLGTWSYIIYDKNKTKESIAEKETVIASTSTQRDELQKELEDAAMRYDELKTTNAKQDSSITVKDIEIGEKKARIQQLLSKANATQAELAEAKQLIKSLNGDIDGYRAQVAILQGQNSKLIVEKEEVITQRNKAQRDFDSSTLVIKDKDNMLDVGSTLNASNFNIVGINEKNNGKEKTTTTAKRVDKMRISFDIDVNKITKSGNKELYVCITDPAGQPIAVQALGSGTFNDREGNEKPYTQKLQISYTQNKKQTVSFDWKQNTNFATGVYKIEVYNNGFKVGEGNKSLKKGGLFS